MLYKWDYSGIADVCYSDENCESYKKSAEFLGDTVEDWGCGTGWSKQYFKNYKGIDGSASKEVKPEDVVDLVNYTSNVENILMRQVLESNINWKLILQNVKKSFRKKFCLIISTPLSEQTHVGSVEEMFKFDGTDNGDINLIFFKKEDILSYFTDCTVKEETIETKQFYGKEWILYIEK